MHLIEGVHWVVVNPFLLLLLLPLLPLPDVRIAVFSFNLCTKEKSPPAADEGKADEESQQEN